ncbi:MAG: DNA methyltransferase [Ignavibacteriaceae bacterium]|nr:DNA methyltransferase [Ignavibacteriaceae bacterium]
MKKIELIKKVKIIIKLDELAKIRKKIEKLLTEVECITCEVILFEVNDHISQIKKEFITNELKQILKTKTIERTKYYLNRLIKSLTENKTSKINDLNLNRWKEYEDIITDSLWILEKRDKSGAHKADYWGNFIPQIPNQLLRRFTKKDDWILDAFAGSGTTLIECKRLGRNGIGIELNADVVKLAKRNLGKEKSRNKVKIKLAEGDSTKVNLKDELKKAGTESVQFVLLHPPYWDIIKFSNKKNDLSNAKSVGEFLEMFGKVIDNTCKVLENERHLAVVIGDKYSDGEWIPLGFYTMQEVMKRGYKLKSTIVKNFDITKGKMNQKELWRYRALAGGFYIFKHEYIFLFKKEKEKQNV